MPTCEEHSEFCLKIGKLIASNEALAATFHAFLERGEMHITEGERPGGVRDRILVMERRLNEEVATAKQTHDAMNKEIHVIKMGYWKVGIGCGFVGAVIGSGCQEAIVMLIKWFTK